MSRGLRCLSRKHDLLKGAALFAVLAPREFHSDLAKGTWSVRAVLVYIRAYGEPSGKGLGCLTKSVKSCVKHVEVFVTKQNKERSFCRGWFVFLNNKTQGGGHANGLANICADTDISWWAEL